MIEQTAPAGDFLPAGAVLAWLMCLLDFAVRVSPAAACRSGRLLGGSMLTETVFSWPGVGRYMLDAIKTKDTPAVLGSVILMSVSFSVVNLFVDILYAFVDPRIKSQYKKNGKKPALRAKKQEA